MAPIRVTTTNLFQFYIDLPYVSYIGSWAPHHGLKIASHFHCQFFWGVYVGFQKVLLIPLCRDDLTNMVQYEELNKWGSWNFKKTFLVPARTLDGESSTMGCSQIEFFPKSWHEGVAKGLVNTISAPPFHSGLLMTLTTSSGKLALIFWAKFSWGREFLGLV